MGVIRAHHGLAHKFRVQPSEERTTHRYFSPHHVRALPTTSDLVFFGMNFLRSIFAHASARVARRNAARPSREFLEEVRFRPLTANIRIAAAEELSTYFGNVLAAGSFAKYDASRRAPFVAMLERVGAFPIPKEMIAVVCEFWLRAGEY